MDCYFFDPPKYCAVVPAKAETLSNSPSDQEVHARVMLAGLGPSLRWDDEELSAGKGDFKFLPNQARPLHPPRWRGMEQHNSASD